MEKTYYYYHRDAENKPRITVCLIEDRGRLAKGIAICSLSDNPRKETGRTLARHRALRAMKRKENSCAILTLKAFNATVGCSGMSGIVKSQYNPIPTEFENELIHTTGPALRA